jgi:hypothetical protein
MSTKDLPTPEEFVNMTVAQLKAYAKKNDIDLFGTSTKEEILEVVLSFYPRVEGDRKEDLPKAPEKKSKAVNKEEPKKQPTVVPTDKVVIFSNKNLHWDEVGILQKGFNIVKKEAADKWLARKSGVVREATPQELAKHYGK